MLRTRTLYCATLALSVLGSSCGAADSDDDNDVLSSATALRTPTSGGGGLILQNASMTPGAVFPVGVATICMPGYAESVRHITLVEKERVAAAYGFTGRYSEVEFDHLISLEIGGSNDPKNLWPQPIAQARVKDRLENYLHDQVCAGKMSLKEAQDGIARDWVTFWNQLGQP
jgi:hypothetical protein